jgi:uncharacterized membrane protein YdjX (TVP38/TMEM64 family)
VARLFLGTSLLVCIVLVAVTFDAAKFEATLLWAQRNPAQGSLVFLGLYTAGVVLMLPAMVMAMAAGAVFGMVFGMLVAWVGSSVGQVIAFVAGRYLLRELVLGYLTRQFPKWTAVDRAMATDGWKLVTLLRLSPIAPWNILNYALAVTSVPLGAYTLASCLAVSELAGGGAAFPGGAWGRPHSQRRCKPPLAPLPPSTATASNS